MLQLQGDTLQCVLREKQNKWLELESLKYVIDAKIDIDWNMNSKMWQE